MRWREGGEARRVVEMGICEGKREMKQKQKME